MKPGICLWIFSYVTDTEVSWCIRGCLVWCCGVSPCFESTQNMGWAQVIICISFFRNKMFHTSQLVPEEFSLVACNYSSSKWFRTEGFAHLQRKVNSITILIYWYNNQQCNPQHKANHEGNTMRKIMGNKPQVRSAIIIHSPLQISWNDLLHQGQTADISIIRGTFSIETLDVHLAPWWEAWFRLIRPSRHARGQPLS
jgi:hypothetical protein